MRQPAPATRNTRPSVSLIVPVLRSEPRLGETLAGLSQLRDSLELELLVVVDVPEPAGEAEARAANDPVAAGHGARVVYRVGRRGFGSALREAFAEAGGEVLIPMMGDASEEPRDVLRLVEGIESGWDVVVGSRYMPGGRIVGQTSKQRLSHLYSWLCRAVGGPDVHDISNAFKAYRRAVVQSIETVAESFDLSVELAVKAHIAGFRVGEVPTTWTNRQLGSSNFSIRREVANYGRWLLLAATRRRRAGSGRLTVRGPSQ